MDAATERLLDSIPLGTINLPSSPSNVFAWPTENCSIACRHCNFGSIGRASVQRNVTGGDKLAQWCVHANASRLVLCGGGEPLEELDFCRGALRTAGRHGLPIALYTSGHAPGQSASDMLHHLTQDGFPDRVWIRLSVDHFHTERIGVKPVAEWLTAVTRLFPHWRVSLRTLRLDHDRSLGDLARSVDGEVRQMRAGPRLVLPGGRQVVVESRGVVFDGRATPLLIERSGLALRDDDAQELKTWAQSANDKGQVGRLLSRRLTVGEGRVDLEIHEDSTVHVLESQPADHRMRYVDRPWSEMIASYRRDPLIHAVARCGLAGVAQVILNFKNKGMLSQKVLTHSIEALSPTESRLVRAHLVLSGPLSEIYSSETRHLAAGVLESP